MVAVVMEEVAMGAVAMEVEARVAAEKEVVASGEAKAAEAERARVAVALVEAEKAKVVKGVAVREVAKAVGDMAGQVVKEVERAEPAAAGCRWPSLLQTACCAHRGLVPSLDTPPQSSSRRSQSTAERTAARHGSPERP